MKEEKGKNGPSLLQGDLPPGTLRILQVSDTHLYANAGGTLVGLNTQETMEQVVELARRTVMPVDLILLTGDLVHDASPAGYGRLRECMEAETTPVYCLPGNHDITDVMHEHLNGGRVQTTTAAEIGNWLLIMLDSTIPGEVGGHLRYEELEKLEANLNAYPKNHVLICLHHHPLPVGSAWMDRMALDNPEPFFDIVDRHPNVQGILWGHIHQEYAEERKGVRLMGSPSTCIQFTPGQDDFGIDDAPPGFRWLALLPDGTIETGVEYLPAAPEGLELDSPGY
jgi:Icc protein